MNQKQKMKRQLIWAAAILVGFVVVMAVLSRIG